MPELSIPLLIFIAAALAFSGLVHGTLGLGFPLTATPLLALFMDMQSAILITLFPTIAVNVLSIAKGGNWHQSIGRFWPMAAFAALGTVIGTEILIISDPAPFKLLLALMILIYLNVERIGSHRLDWISHYPRLSMAAFGLVAGVMAGTVNVMVPILVIFILEMGLATTAMVQVFNLCFLAGKTTQIGVFSLEGLLPGDLLLQMIPGVIAAVAALLIGMRIRDHIAGELYRKILKRLLLAMAAVLVIQFGMGA